MNSNLHEDVQLMMSVMGDDAQDNAKTEESEQEPLPLAIIVDLDGTLCDTSHRTHFVEKFPKNWDGFYDGIPDDQPNVWCSIIMENIKMNCKIIIVTGRPMKQKVFDDTVEWLDKYNIPYHELHCRDVHDFRSDVEVKREIYRDQIKGNYNVLFCLEDRSRVAQMWREEGLVCLQCAKGDY
jgi:hypothetical protein